MSEWEELAGLADAVPVPLLGIDEEGKVRLVNRSGCEFLALARQQLLDHELGELFRDPGRAAEFQTALRRGSADSHRFVCRRGDGGSQRVEATPSSVAGLHGLRQGWIVMLRDAESDAKVQRDLSRSIERVAHDIRNPLASLLGFTNLLEREFGELLEGSGRGYLDSLRSNIDRVQEQLERLIELGRIPERELERSLILSNAVFTEVAQELKVELDRGGVSLSLPADPQPVYANKQRFQQVVLNLIVNAIQHMGQVTEPEIRIELKPVEGGHLLVVQDNGLGLPPDEHLRIYDLFRSARFGTDPRSQGLGLSIVKRIMAAHGGYIELDSRPSESAVFRAFFPAHHSS